ncbi:ribosomal-processing cysteine protease Prp [Pseudoramibacter alactolyticus]|uniref:ribosomal-processing cysteine protease Prp n=1 Tax=Pseudoramibacter alactolyticus TaxID=113287 RepID=UPI0028ECB815|nr:ribosomal-processing cysteine protease Prp [Pseudoramibacter alactolyticus]
MIDVTITKDHLILSGHARTGPYGQDIVCAAVSTLVQTLEQAIRELTDDVIDCEIGPGYFNLITKHLSSAAWLLVDAFLLGIFQIAESYPGNVRIVREDTPKP